MTATEIPVDGTGVVVRWEPAAHGRLDVGLQGDGTDAAPDVVAATVAVIEEIRSRHPDRALRLIGNHPREGRLPLPAPVAAAFDLRPTRELHQLRRPLPVPDDHSGRSGVPPLALRPFRPGHDDDAWLRVNNAAFATHPDQGGQTREDLARTLAEPWVDLTGFLVSDDPDAPGELAGFCWTRVHPADDVDPVLGEIYVIGVAPAHHGRRLGATLVLAGLDHLAWVGIGTGMLYVEGDNAPAQKLYARLGFTTHLIIEMFT
ncbi:mycothiol synthase [Aquihabitans daechungensis]|uniref:mycothiol synthase n=1 Tax=Aquihabitans daechungensis TaxID=1052257 RepID=UPI003B9EC6C5